MGLFAGASQYCTLIVPPALSSPCTDCPSAKPLIWQAFRQCKEFSYECMRDNSKAEFRVETKDVIDFKYRGSWAHCGMPFGS